MQLRPHSQFGKLITGTILGSSRSTTPTVNMVDDKSEHVLRPDFHFVANNIKSADACGTFAEKRMVKSTARCCPGDIPAGTVANILSAITCGNASKSIKKVQGRSLHKNYGNDDRRLKNRSR